MNTVSSVITRKGGLPVTVSPEMTVTEALTIMAEKNIGSVVVMQNEEYLGIMTERDYSRKVILKGKNSTATKVSEILNFVCKRCQKKISAICRYLKTINLPASYL